MKKQNQNDFASEQHVFIESAEQVSQLKSQEYSENSFRQKQVLMGDQKGSLQKLIACLIVLLGILFLLLRRQQSENCVNQPLLEGSPLAFKKVVWFYTENQLEGELMYQLIFLYHNNHTFLKNGYQVRFVNSLTAYNFITDNQTIARITHAMQHSQMDEGVHNLLKLALLLQNGGVVINNPDTIFPHSDLAWIQGLFTLQNQTPYNYTIPPQNAEVFLYHFNNKSFERSAAFIAARPNATFIREAFDTLLALISTGGQQYARKLGILSRNWDTNVDYLRNGLQDVLNLVIYKHQRENNISFCSYFRMQSLQHKNYISLSQIAKPDQQRILFQEGFTQTIQQLNNNIQVDIIFELNLKTRNFLNTIASNINIRNPDPLPLNSLIASILSSPNNKEVFVDPLPPREIELCLIVMENLSKVKANIMREELRKQTYSRWKLVIPSDYQLNSSKANIEDKLVIIQGRSSKVHNIEQACTKHCDPKGYAVLLNFADSFNHQAALEQIAMAMKPRDMMGAFIGLQHNGSKVVPEVMKFNRVEQGIVNPNIKKMELILNHLRVFSIEAFRYIPQFDLRNMYGKYFQDRLIFLMTLLEMIDKSIEQPQKLYVAKKYNQIFNIPNKVQALPPTTLLKVLTKQTVNQDQLKLTRSRLHGQSLYQSVSNTLRWKIPFTKMLAFNPGNEFVSIDEKKGPQLIPKVIHQVWLGGQMPPVKEYFYKKTQKIYPNYEVKVWRNQNITREKFPLTYDVMQTLIEFNKRSPYSKLATVTDILRHQLLYYDGGFWKDAGMNMLRPIFDKFVTYKLAIAVDQTFRYRWLQGMCFFANMPKLENMWRITNFRNTNRMRIYEKYPMIIAGPIDFRSLIVGQQEYDPDFLLMPYETTYPGQWTQHPEKDRCLRSKSTIGNQKYELQENGCYLLSNCDQIYPYSFAIEHNCFGNSWPNRKSVFTGIFDNILDTIF